ncbi:MAG: hypothetical protein F4Z58_04350 [Acidimicrobiaceae bacterium]|nr:hypothetical protein [Acidimicrobiaceae bacterium]MXW75260.1 hypothetical protein [Acidimicrobiaceae bacterium]MYG55375.1 hypothetical protein [Acidimicrobiaceae bacterium]
MTDADDLTADLDREFPLTGTEFVQWSRDGNQLPYPDPHLDILGNVRGVELGEIGDRFKSGVVVVERENLVVSVPVDGASVSAELAQPDAVSEPAAVENNEVLIRAVGAFFVGKKR